MLDFFNQRSNRTTCAVTQDELPGAEDESTREAGVVDVVGRRKKLIHTLGVVASVEFVSNGEH